MVFIFQQINSNLDSGWWHIPSLPARCHVCLRKWECVGVWVLFCFLHRLCRPSPALTDHSLQASAQLHYLAGWTSHFSSYSLMCGHSPPPRTSRNMVCRYPNPLGAADLLPLPVTPRRSVCGGEGAKAGWCRVLAWLCPLGQGTGSTKQGTSAGSQQESTSHYRKESACACCVQLMPSSNTTVAVGREISAHQVCPTPGETLGITSHQLPG